MKAMLDNPLSTWADGECKEAILRFLHNTTQPDSKYFLKPEERVAVFDNDGTLWVEKPLNTEITFILDQMQQHAILKEQRTSIIDKLKMSFEHEAADILNDVDQLATYLYKGLTTSEFKLRVEKWISTALHPQFNTLYTKLAYVPMLEVLELFDYYQFDCFIVSGGSSSFVRPWSPEIYKIQPQNVIGSSLKTKLETREDELVLEIEPIPFYFDNGPAKVRAINRIIGKHPVAAFGNSNGDVEMLQWASQSPYSIAMLIHHTDAVREYCYSPDPLIHLGESTLNIAKDSKWNIMDMKKDWLTIFADGIEKDST